MSIVARFDFKIKIGNNLKKLIMKKNILLFAFVVLATICYGQNKNNNVNTRTAGNKTKLKKSAKIENKQVEVQSIGYDLGDYIATSQCYNFYKNLSWGGGYEEAHVILKVTASVENISKNKIQIKVIEATRERNTGDCSAKDIELHIYNVYYGTIPLLKDKTYWIDPNVDLVWSKI